MKNPKNTICKEFVIINELGLHARPATMFVELAMRYKSSIEVTSKESGRKADGKSVLGMLMLACPQGAKIVVEISGEDRESAMKEISALIEGGFGE